MSEIRIQELSCVRCGGQLKVINNNTYQCTSCGKTFEKQIVTDVADQLRAVLNEQKQEAVANLRRQLWAEMHEENINSEKIRGLARDIKKYLPEDYFANFCEIANSEVENNSKQINSFLDKSPQSAIEDYADIVLDFMIKSLRTENITALSQLIERAYKGRDNDSNYDKYTTWLESEADKIDKGIYDLDIPRDVFLAYSSADMDKVLEICDYLESNNISCFLALRNLRHGRNAIHNYDQALKTAIDHCKTIVFVSSTHSRSRSCDAFTMELPYIRQKDLEVAPPQYRHAYDKLPAKYKMPRVEYVIEDYCGNVAENKVKEFFNGLEWCKNKEALADRILGYLIAEPETTEAQPDKKAYEEFDIQNGVLVKYYGSDTQVYIPYSVKKIGDRAFSYCESLISITIPNGVTSIGEQAFRDCESLTSINIPNSVTSINKWAFDCCKSLTSIILPDSVISIGECAFYNCESLTSINIPNNVTTIGKEAFYNCESLTSIIIPKNVTSIGDSAFSCCPNLKTIYCRANKPLLGLPKGWDKGWLGTGNFKCKAQVIWNYKGN